VDAWSNYFLYVYEKLYGIESRRHRKTFSGKVKTPDEKLIPADVPVLNSDNAGYLHWRKIEAKFLHTNCMAAGTFV
jgi:hypothetical protein